MTYLYTRSKNAELDKCLQLVDFKKFNTNENCRLIFDLEQIHDFKEVNINENFSLIRNKNTIDFFTLDTLEFGISNRIYRIEEGKLHLIQEDSISNNNFPLIKNQSGKLFYDNLLTNLENYGKIFKYLVVSKRDFQSFMNAMMKIDITEEKFTKHEISNICRIFFASGNVHLFMLKNLDGYVVGNVHGFQYSRLYFPCKNPDELFEILLERFKSGELLDDVRDIALYNCDINLSERNFRIVKVILDKKYPELINFYETQMFCEGKKLTIMDRSLDDLVIFIGKNLNYSQIKVFLVNVLIERLKKGEKVSSDDFLSLFVFERFTDEITLEVFNLVSLPLLENETNFQVYVEKFKKFTFDLKDKIFDMLMSRINLDIVNITADGCYEILSSRSISKNRLQQLENFLKTSKDPRIIKIKNQINWKKLSDDDKYFNEYFNGYFQ